MGEAVLFSFFKFYIMRLLYYFYDLKKNLRGKMCSNQTNGRARGGNEKCWFPFLMIPTPPPPPHTEVSGFLTTGFWGTASAGNAALSPERPQAFLGIRETCP